MASPSDLIRSSKSNVGHLTNELTRLFNIQHPILLAGMNVVAGPRLAAAVTNAGGMGVLGARTWDKSPEYDTFGYDAYWDNMLRYTPELLRQRIHELKSYLKDPNAPFGVDILIVKTGDGAKKSNIDYTFGRLDEMVDVVIEEKASLFVSAVGSPPPHVIKKLQKAGIVVADIIGHPKHAKKALDLGVDMIICQGGEGGGHTGDIASSILTPYVVDLAAKYTSPLTGKPVMVVAAGAIHRGRSLAAALMWGAQGVWVGTRMLASNEAGASDAHQQAALDADFDSTVRTKIFTGKTLRVIRNAYIDDWERNRTDEAQRLLDEGVIPAQEDIHGRMARRELDPRTFKHSQAYLMGQVAAVIDTIEPAQKIVDDMVVEAVNQLRLVEKMTQPVQARL